MIRIPCKITLEGDKDHARNFIGAAQSQLRILENQMSFQDLKKGARKVRLDPKTVCDVNVCFDLSEVRIHSEPEIIKIKEELGLDKLCPRFFAYVVRKDEITGINSKEYYWLYFNKKSNNLDEFQQTNGKTATELTEDYEVYVWKIAGTIRDAMIFDCAEKLKENKKELVEKMKDVPYSAASVFTKAFTTYAPDDEDKEDGRRFAAAAHLMTSDCENVFEPVNWPNCIGNIKKDPMPVYPRPIYCGPTNPRLVGLNLRCPPNRFYCNTEERIMVWYTAKSYSPEIYGQDFICGVILNLNTASIQSFTFYPWNGDGHDFTPYWTIMDSMEIPFSMITEVEDLTEDELTITIQWEKRPIRIKAFLKTGEMEYEEITDVKHRVWSGTESGFDKKTFLSFQQNFEGPLPDHDITVTQEGYDCSQHDGDSENCCGHERDIEGRQTSIPACNDEYKHSEYTLDIYTHEYDTVADRKFEDLGDNITTKIHRCIYTTGDRCSGQIVNMNRGRGLNQSIETKKSNGVYASWVNPNTAFILREHTRDYLTGSAQYGGYEYGGASLSDWQEQCPFNEYPDFPITFRCFYRFPQMSEAIWNRLGNEVYDCSGASFTLARDGTDDIESQTEINEYTIDKTIILSNDEVDRIYYLDDRATDNNQGILVAAKSNSDEVLYGGYAKVAVYKPDSWKINWKITWNEDDRSLHGCTTSDENTEYIDIKEKLLEALGCKVHELIDIGLV
jgi:hypothetical protein